MDEDKEIELSSLQSKEVFEVPSKMEPLDKIIAEEDAEEKAEPNFKDQQDLKASVKNEVENYLSPKKESTPSKQTTSSNENKISPNYQKEISHESKPNQIFQNNIRTFRGDIENTIKNNKTSVVQMAVAESDKKSREGIEQEQPSSNKTLIIAGVSVAIILGIGAVVLGFMLSQNNQPTATPLTVSFLINVNTQKGIDLTNSSTDGARSAIGNEVRKDSIPLDNITGLYFTHTADDGTKNLLDASSFLNSIGSNVPEALLRVLDPDFTFGIHSYDGNNPFIILKTNFYQGAYAGLLSWEENIVSDLNGWFTNFNPSSQTISGNSGQVLKQGYQFSDEVIKNKDARVLRDSSGKIILLYSIIDQQTIIITTSEDTFKEVINRLIAMKLVR